MITLTTERLHLVPFDKKDFENLKSLFQDPFVRKYLWDDQVVPGDTIREILNKNQEHFLKNKWGLWKIIESKHGIIGFSGLWLFFGQNQPQLLYGLYPPFTGSGFATEAAARIIQYAFEALKFDYVEAAMDKPHKSSQNVAERLGMKFHKETLEDGKPTLFYRIGPPTPRTA